MLGNGLNGKTAYVLGDRHSFRTSQTMRMKTVRSFETSGITNPVALCNDCERDNANETGY